MTKPAISCPVDPFLTTKEAAQRLGVCLRTIQLWVEAGTLHAARTPGGHRRIRVSDVKALQGSMGIQQTKKAPVLLTDDQIGQLVAMHWGDVGVPAQSVADFARRVQALVISTNGWGADRG